MTQTQEEIKTYPAGFASKCKVCEKDIEIGDLIARYQGSGSFVHVECCGVEVSDEKKKEIENAKSKKSGFKGKKESGSGTSPDESRKTATCKSNRVCKKCGQMIEKGTKITPWLEDPEAAEKGWNRWVHLECPSQEPEVDADEVRSMIREMISKLDFSKMDDKVESAIDKSVRELEKRLSEEMGTESAKMATELATLVRESVKKLGEELSVPREIEVRKPDGTKKKIEGHTHKAFERVLQLASMRKHIFLPGPAGCGKSHLAEQVAESLELKFGFISCSAGMSEGQLTGRLIPTGESGTFEYASTQFVECYENGGVFLCDEIDAADPNVLLVINAALANGKLALPNRKDNPVAEKHEDFIFIAAANTFGNGADRMYVGRNELDEATLDRFRIGTVTMDYDPVLDQILCPHDVLRKKLLDIRQKAQKARLRRLVSTRFLKDAHDMVAADLWTVEDVINSLFSGWSDDEKAKVSN